MENMPLGSRISYEIRRWPIFQQNPCVHIIKFFIKNWIIGYCNSRVFIGLAIMGYDPLYHTNMVSVCMIFLEAFFF